MSTASNVKRALASVGDLIPPRSAKTRATAEGGSKKRHFYKPLPKEFRHDGFDYWQIAHEGNAAVYEQTWSGCSNPSVCYEVIRIRRRDGFEIDGRFVEPAEVYPNSEAWGVDGFTLTDKDAAFAKLREIVASAMITEPLFLLFKIGILDRKRPAVFVHIKTSTVYCFAHPYCKKHLQLKVVLTPKLAQKRACAPDRREQRLNRKFPWRKKLLADLCAISFSDLALRIIAKELSRKGRENLVRVVGAIDTQEHFVKVSERGQITTSIGSCPRDLQPHLLLDGEPIVSCDVSNAHWNFLPLILANRLHHVSGERDRGKYVNDGWREHNRLTAFLSQGDFYCAWCLDPKNDTERTEKKDVLTILLNKKNEDCQQNRLYRRIAAEFPITFAIIEDIKRDDNRNLSKQLHRFTADAIAAALLEVQQKGIAGIPHVDALICQEKYRERVCEIIGRQIFEATGVCCTVGGPRYSPLTDIEEQALAFDEIAPSDDGMSYDEWEAVRIVKCVAALKLMRRCPRLLVPVALAA